MVGGDYTFEEFLAEGRDAWIPIVPPRRMTNDERQLIERLLAEPFAGHEQLQLQVPSVRVFAHGLTGDPSFKMSPTRDASLAAQGTRGRVPIEAQGRDTAGREVAVYLHVIAGFLAELEVIGESDQPPGLPSLDGLRVV